MNMLKGEIEINGYCMFLYVLSACLQYGVVVFRQKILWCTGKKYRGYLPWCMTLFISVVFTVSRHNTEELIKEQQNCQYLYQLFK